MLRKSAVAWFKLCSALLFLDKGIGEEDTDGATVHESFELSELNDTSITPFGLPGTELNLRLFDWLPGYLDAISIMSWLQSSTLSCSDIVEIQDSVYNEIFLFKIDRKVGKGTHLVDSKNTQ